MDAFAHLVHGIEKTGHRLDDRQIQAFIRYRDEIRRVNKSLGLISKNDLDRIPTRHFLDSLTPVFKGILPTSGEILDIGSGGGFPGIPLAIFLPCAEFVLVESNRKKSTFLRHMMRVLALKNVTVHTSRAESLPALISEKRYDVAVTRAVGSIGQMAGWCVNVLKPGGKLICYKGPNPDEEIESAGTALEKQGMMVEGIYRYEEGLTGSPTLVVLRKC